MESSKNDQLAFTVISAASDEDLQAIEAILKHYDRYISKCCLKALYDEHGMMCVATDAELKGLIQSALIRMILKFEIIIK